MTARLTSSDVVAMRAEWLRGDLLRDIAARHGVSGAAASQAINGRTFRDVPMPEGLDAGRAKSTEGRMHWTKRLPDRMRNLPVHALAIARRELAAARDLSEEWRLP